MQQENTRLKLAQLDQCQKGQEVMKAQVQEAVLNAKLAEERSERNDQYSRRNNIKLLFIEESTDSFESAEKSEEKALRVFHEKMGLRYIKPEHTEAAHRVGKKVAGKTRPIIVKFVSRKTKQDVIKNRRKLKNSDPKVVIVEDLTKHTFNLFLQASDHPGTMGSWTAKGKVFVQDFDSKVYKIDNLSDLRRLPIDDAPDISTPAGTAVLHRRLENMRSRRGNRCGNRSRWNIFPDPLSHDADSDQTTKKTT